MRRPRPEIIHRATLGALGIVLILLPFGCLEPTQEDDSNAPSTTSSSLPTLDEIRASVDMSDAQAEKLGTAVERWHSATQSSSTAESFVSPELEFIAESATILDRQQLRQLVHVLAENHGSIRGPEEGAQHQPPADCPGCPAGGPGAGMHGGRHHGGPGGGPGPFADLGLSTTQLQAVHAAMQTMQTAVRTAREQFEAGTITEAGFRQAVDAARQAFDTALQGVLTPEQYAKLQQIHRDRLIEHLERQIEHLRAGAAHYLELLTRILDLSPTQVASITEIHTGLIPRLEAILAGVKDGTLTLAAAQESLRTVHEEARAAVVAVLTPEQAALFAELRPFGHRRGPGMPPD